MISFDTLGVNAIMETTMVRTNLNNLRFMPNLTADLREKLIDILLRISTQRSVPNGTDFIHEEEHIDNKGYILLDGAILVRKLEHQDIKCVAPELIGEMQQFNPSQTRTATLTTSMPSTMLRFQWDEFWAATQQDLTPPEVESVRKTLETYAWEHFTN